MLFPICNYNLFNELPNLTNLLAEAPLAEVVTHVLSGILTSAVQCNYSGLCTVFSGYRW